MQKSIVSDRDLLEEKITASGLKLNYILNQLGISRQAFDRKRKGQTAFRQSEVYVLCDLLNITDGMEKIKIFYPKG